MQTYEINSVLKYSYYKHKESWCQSRLVSYLIAQSNSTKKLKLEDIIKFSWEQNDPINNSDNTVTKEELEAMMQDADEVKKLMFGE